MLRILTVIVFLFTSTFLVQAQNPVPTSPRITILAVDGTIQYAHEGWNAPQLLAAGAMIEINDFIYPKDASLVVLCPDGAVREFLPSELFPNDVVQCPTNTAAYRIGDTGEQRLSMQRGGRQDVAIPYLIAPRATLVNTPLVTLRWNDPGAVKHFTAEVLAEGASVWHSGELAPVEVVFDGQAQLDLPISLQPQTAYSVKICVVFADLRDGCTTDPGWANGVDTSFYYVPAPDLEIIEQQIITALGKDTPETLYAQAVLWSQPGFTTAQGVALGNYDRAITLLETLRRSYPASALANSSDFYILLGELYTHVQLPISAAQAFQRGLTLAPLNSDAAARAALGNGVTTPDPNQAIALLDQALDIYAAYLTETAFAERFAQTCGLLGDLCLDLSRCQTQLDTCIMWRES